MVLFNMGNARCRVGFKSRWIPFAGLMSGLSFFLLTLFYFGFENISDYTFGDLLLSTILPLTLIATFIVMLCGLRSRITPVYGILGGIYCLLMIIHACTTGSGAEIVLAFLWYIPAMAVSVAATFSYLTYPWLMAIAYFVPAAFRFLSKDLSGYLLEKEIVAYMPRAALLAGLLAFGFFGLTLKMATPKKRKRTE